MYIKNITIKILITIYYQTESGVNNHQCWDEQDAIDFINWLIDNKYKIFKITTEFKYN